MRKLFTYTICLFLFLFLLSIFGVVFEEVRAGYEGDVVRKNDFGYYEFEIIPFKPYILENPCNPIYSIQIVFKNENHRGKKLKMTAQQLDMNPTRVDVPGLEYTYCYFNLVAEFFTENPEGIDSNDYILTFDFKVDRNWIDKNNIDEDTLTSYVFENELDTWKDHSTSLVTTSSDEMRFVTTIEENRPNFALSIAGFPPRSYVFETGASSWWYILGCLGIAGIIEYLPDIRMRKRKRN